MVEKIASLPIHQWMMVFHVSDIPNTGLKTVCLPAVESLFYFSELLPTSKCPAVDVEEHTDSISCVLDGGTNCCNTTVLYPVLNFRHNIPSRSFKLLSWLLRFQPSQGSPCNSGGEGTLPRSILWISLDKALSWRCALPNAECTGDSSCFCNCSSLVWS